MTLSKIAAEQARRNALAAEAAVRDARAAGMAPDALLTGSGSADPAVEAVLIAEKLVDRNAPAVASRQRRSIADLHDFAAALDEAADVYEKAVSAFEERFGRHVAQIRSARMAVTTEVDTTLRALKDASAFLGALADQKAFALLADLVRLGKDCREAFGEGGLARLAEALLVLAERRP